MGIELTEYHEFSLSSNSRLFQLSLGLTHLLDTNEKETVLYKYRENIHILKFFFLQHFYIIISS